MPTLEELKKENELEAAAAQGDDTATDEPELDAVDEEAEAPADDEGGDDQEASDSDDWTKPQGGEQEPEAKFTDGDAAAIRRKWKGKVSEKDSEIEALKKEIEAIKAKPAAAPAPTGKPKHDEFNSDEDFIEALTDYKISLTQQQSQSEQAAAERKRQQEANQSKTAEAVDGHYTRAMKLAEKSNITPEAYQSADMRVRQAIDSVFPKAGDTITDALIASLGEGSERVFYNLGVNSSRRAEMVKLLQEDKTGIRAATYLGKLNAELSAPQKRQTSAPTPVDQLQGDHSTSTAGDKLLRQYKEAHKRGDGSAAFNIKRQAKQAGVNVATW